jgi:hypothetical protein
MLCLVGFNNENQHFQPIRIGSALAGVPQRLDFLESRLILAFRTVGMPLPVFTQRSQGGDRSCE